MLILACGLTDGGPYLSVNSCFVDSIGTTDRVCMVTGSLENVRKVHNFLLDKVKEKPDAIGTVGDVKVDGKIYSSLNITWLHLFFFISECPKCCSLCIETGFSVVHKDGIGSKRRDAICNIMHR